jgi:hypothetical protein
VCVCESERESERERVRERERGESRAEMSPCLDPEVHFKSLESYYTTKLNEIL